MQYNNIPFRKDNDDINQINHYIADELQMLHHVNEISCKIFEEIKCYIMEQSPMVYDLPTTIQDKPLQIISGVYKTYIENQQVVFPITCIDFHSKKLMNDFIGEQKNEVIPKRYKNKGIFLEGNHYLPLTFYSANKNIQMIVPKPFEEILQDFVVGQILNIDYTHNIDIKTAYQNTIAYFIEKLQWSQNPISEEVFYQNPLYLLIKESQNNIDKKDILKLISHARIESIGIHHQFFYYKTYLSGYVWDFHYYIHT